MVGKTLVSDNDTFLYAAVLQRSTDVAESSAYFVVASIDSVTSDTACSAPATGAAANPTTPLPTPSAAGSAKHVQSKAIANHCVVAQLWHSSLSTTVLCTSTKQQHVTAKLYTHATLIVTTECEQALGMRWYEVFWGVHTFCSSSPPPPSISLTRPPSAPVALDALLAVPVVMLPIQAGTLVHTAQSMRRNFYHTFDSSVLKHCAGTTMPCIMLALR
eukprot:6050-Heterococcus_DN1.PRE.1